jgi:hypothetical protein
MTASEAVEQPPNEQKTQSMKRMRVEVLGAKTDFAGLATQGVS